MEYLDTLAARPTDPVLVVEGDDAQVLRFIRSDNRENAWGQEQAAIGVESDDPPRRQRPRKPESDRCDHAHSHQREVSLPVQGMKAFVGRAGKSRDQEVPVVET